MHYMNPDVEAVLFVIALVVALVVLVRSQAASLLAWACVAAFFVLAWDGVTAAQWFS